MEPIEIQEVPVLFIEAEGGPKGAARAFEELERRLGSSSGRRFYGVFLKGRYRACVGRRDGDSPSALGLEEGVIPRGPYARRRLEGGTENIGPTMDALAKEHPFDPERPEVELYRRGGEVILMLPILPDRGE